MFAGGLAICNRIRLEDEPGLAERLGLVAAELDATIRELRGAIFGSGRGRVHRWPRTPSTINRTKAQPGAKRG
jgi:hypothetical protein